MSRAQSSKDCQFAKDAVGSASAADSAAPTWSLITVTYNSAISLREYWGGTNLSNDVEWIVVDNASSDESASVANELAARVISSPMNLGFGAANNLGMSNASGKYVMFANPDVTPVQSDLARLASYIDAHPNELVAPQLVFPDGTPQPNGRGAAYLSAKILHRLQPGRLNGSYRLIADPGDELVVHWLTGAVVAASRSRFETLGPWDEHFFVYYEDVDLGERNRRAGGTSTVLGDVRWVHGWARETSGLNWKAWRLELSSMLRFYRRYPNLLLTPHFRVRGESRLAHS